MCVILLQFIHQKHLYNQLTSKYADVLDNTQAVPD